MDNNDIINNNLLKIRDEHLKQINAFNDANILIRALMDELIKFDFEAYKFSIKNEITHNLQAFWTNTEKGILKKEKLYAILFEFGDFNYEKGAEASAYGIGKWENYQIQTDAFDMGDKYDFTTNFYAHPGLSLDFFDGLEKIPNADVWKRQDDIFWDKIELDEATSLMTWLMK